MQKYFDIKIIPCAELPVYEVMSYVMQLLHQALPKYDGRVGLSFPNYDKDKTRLGNIIRVFATETEATNLHKEMSNDNTVASYTVISKISDIPATITGYAIFRRKPMKRNSTIKRLEKRHKVRGTWTDDLKNAIAQNHEGNAKKLPHVHLKSISTKQPKMTIFIEEEKQNQFAIGKFNAYGLSINDACVPLF